MLESHQSRCIKTNLEMKLCQNVSTDLCLTVFIVDNVDSQRESTFSYS